MTTATTDTSAVTTNTKVEIWQIAPLLIATCLLTIGLAMFLSGTHDVLELVQPLIVVFGGTLAFLLLTFPVSQILLALQLSLERGLRGGTRPEEMVGVMLKICDVSRREGLLGVADLRSNHAQVEDVCALIGDAAEVAEIDSDHAARVAAEKRLHGISADVFLFTALYAVVTGVLGSLVFLVQPQNADNAGPALLPLVCGLCLGLLATVLLGRLRAAHRRELLVSDIAFRGAALILDDNNVKRLQGRLASVLSGSGQL